MNLKNSSKRHSEWSASGSHTWLACPGSVNQIRKTPADLKPPETEYAREGSAAHALSDLAFRSNVCPTKLRVSRLDKQWQKYVDDEMRSYIADFFKWVKDLQGERELHVEKKFDLSWLRPKMFGTTDILLVEFLGDIWVIDLKYGRGVVVDAEENSQLIYYALGMAHELGWEFERAHLIIYQPRSKGPKTSEWVISRDELHKWIDVFGKGVDKTLKKDAPLVPGEKQCRFCDARLACPAVKKVAKEALNLEFDEVPVASKALVVAEVPKLPMNTLSNILQHADMIEDYISEVRSYAHKLAEKGHKIPGFKLVEKRAQRVWKDAVKAEKQALSLVGKKAHIIYNKKFKTPAQLEKVLDRKWVAKNVVSVSSGSRLVSVHSKEKEVKPQIESEFDDAD